MNSPICILLLTFALNPHEKCEQAKPIVCIGDVQAVDKGEYCMCTATDREPFIYGIEEETTL